MSVDNVAPAGGDSPAIAPSAPAELPTSMSPREAAQALAAQRWKRDNPEAPPAEASQPEPELDAAPPQEEPGEIATEAQAEPEAEALPPIDPPRSWPREWKEEFQSYPRDLQEKIAQREQQRDTELRRGQNEHAEKLKGLTAKEQAAEQARSQYEQALPALWQTLQSQMSGEFSDIKTMQDVERLAREDWPRYALWDAQQKKLAAVAQEMNAAQQRQATEAREKWTQFATQQDQLFSDKVPEMADPVKGKALRESAVDVLRDVGFDENELSSMWDGQQSLSLRDHRVQLLIRDAVRLRDAQKAIARPVPKPVPPVQRPGVSGARIDQGNLELKALERRASETGNPRDYARLLAARRASANRRTG